MGINEDNELLFAEKLKELVELAGVQGKCVAKDQIDEVFHSFELSKEQYELLLGYLKANHIGVGEPIDAGEYLSEEEKGYLQEYLQELEELPIVKAGEKEAVILSAMAGDEDAQARLITIYLPYVVDIAKLYAGFEVMIEDLIGEGNVALTIGASMLGSQENVQEAEGLLGKMIMDAMERLLEDTRRLKEEDNEIVKKVNYIAEHAKELSEDYRRKVTVEEIVKESSLSEEEVRDAIFISGNGIEYVE